MGHEAYTHMTDECLYYLGDKLDCLRTSYRLRLALHPASTILLLTKHIVPVRLMRNLECELYDSRGDKMPYLYTDGDLGSDSLFFY